MNKYLTPKGFLQLGGVILLALGVIGYLTQILFPPQGKFIGDVLYLDNFENIAHTVLGIVALAAAYTLSSDLQKWLVILVGLFGIVVTIFGLVNLGVAAPNMGITNLELLDDVIHGAVGVWALYAALAPGPRMAPVR